MYLRDMNVVKLDDFRSHTTPLASIIRVGDFNQQFAQYVSQNLIPGRRAVVDSYNVAKQADLLNELKASGFELTLDTKAAELACAFKWSGQARKAEWLEKEPRGALSSTDFDEQSAARIAELAVKNGFHVVLSPSRYVSEGSAIKTLEQDHEFMALLRAALDAAGGKRIKIASSFIGRLSLLGQDAITDRLIELHRTSPADSMWMRLHGLKRDPGPSRIRTAARRLELFKKTELPLVLDYAAGLEPLTLAALGVVGGLAFGALANDQFSDATWVSPSKSLDNSVANDGRQQFARVPGLGRNFSHAELRLMSEATKGKRLLFDPANTGISSFDEFKKKARETALKEGVEAIGGLSKVPDTRRTHHIRTTHLDQNARKARQLANLELDQKRAAELKVRSPETLPKRLNDYAGSLDKTGQVLEKIASDSSIRLTKPIPLVRLGTSIEGSEGSRSQ
ncbi:MAG: hypothetical protein CL955_10805 [Erythrobacteraceae bacterium]|nr:hypothetical protein [Erythrobacteraceae bacterium]|tara:strand:+ start:133 stop:1488 length:1356 start_codon:yes stop_codon:yes gene_type:complete